MLQVMLVDDHAAMREGVKSVLGGEVNVVGECGNGPAAILMARHIRPDVILMDIRMKGMSGFEATRRILVECPRQHVVLYTGHDESGLLAEGLNCGAQGYVLKGAPVTDILRAIQVVADGGVYVDPSLAGAAVGPRVVPRLSPREAQMLTLLSQGKNYPQMAGSLFLSVETVRTHVRNAMVKLDATTRTQAVTIALGLGLIGTP